MKLLPTSTFSCCLLLALASTCYGSETHTPDESSKTPGSVPSSKLGQLLLPRPFAYRSDIPIEYKKGDRVSYYSKIKRKWSHDGKVHKVKKGKMCVNFDRSFRRVKSTDKADVKIKTQRNGKWVEGTIVRPPSKNNEMVTVRSSDTGEEFEVHRTNARVLYIWLKMPKSQHLVKPRPATEQLERVEPRPTKYKKGDSVFVYCREKAGWYPDGKVVRNHAQNGMICVAYGKSTGTTNAKYLWQKWMPTSRLRPCPWPPVENTDPWSELPVEQTDPRSELPMEQTDPQGELPVEQTDRFSVQQREPVASAPPYKYCIERFQQEELSRAVKATLGEMKPEKARPATPVDTTWEHMSDLERVPSTPSQESDVLSCEEFEYFPAVPRDAVEAPSVSDGHPEDFCCPITFGLMEEPVSLNACGHTFEKNALKDWLKKEHRSDRTCPFCNKKINSSSDDPFHTNWSLKSLIDKYNSEKKSSLDD